MSERKNPDHLIQALKKQYTISTDWTGSLFFGLHIQWEYTLRTCNISISDYIKEALHKFQHPKPPRPQNAPHAWKAPTYGAKIKYAGDGDQLPLFPPKSIHLVQQIVGTLPHYSVAVDTTMLVALGKLSSQQYKATKQTYDATMWLLNYANSNPNATICYTASDMNIYVHSNASYLSAPLSQSRACVHYFLSNSSPDPTQPPKTRPRFNGPIHTVSKIVSNVMGSAAKDKIGATYINGQKAVPIRTLLRELGNPQPATPMQVDNSTAVGFSNDTIRQRQSKAINMHFYWIRDRTSRGQFLVYWQQGITNLAYYHTKKYSPAHHCLMQSK